MSAPTFAPNIYVRCRPYAATKETRDPNALWIVQQMRGAWPYAPAHRVLLFDRDSKFGNDVISSAKDMGSPPRAHCFCSPWQNGVAERRVGSRRPDLLDHAIVLNDRYLKRLMVSTYATTTTRTRDRTPLGLAKGARHTPAWSHRRDPGLQWEAGFNPSHDSADCTIVTQRPH
jgi:hypothetical protein